MFITINKKTLIKFFVAVIVLLLIILATALNPIDKIAKKIYPLTYNGHILKYAEEYELDPYLVMAIISTESKFNESAQSHKDAKGLMQITDATFDWVCEKYNLEYTKNDIFTPQANIHTGCAYMAFLLGTFNYDLKTALSAYNAGQGNVNKWLKNKQYSTDGKKLENIPFDETKNYVDTVIKRINIYKKLY